jgi:serine/threonine protein kinase
MVYKGLHRNKGNFVAIKQVVIPRGYVKSQLDSLMVCFLSTCQTHPLRTPLLTPFACSFFRFALLLLQLEIDLLKILQHHNIVKYIDHYCNGKTINIVLEYVVDPPLPLSSF